MYVRRWEGNGSKAQMEELVLEEKNKSTLTRRKKFM